MTSTDDIADQPPGVAGQKIASALLSRVPALADELPSPSPVEPIDGNVKRPDCLVEAPGDNDRGQPESSAYTVPFVRPLWLVCYAGRRDLSYSWRGKVVRTASAASSSDS